MRSLHICEVIKTLDVGGAEVLLVERLLAAPPTGKRYTVVCLRTATQELSGRLRSAGIHVIDLTSCPRWLRLARLAHVVRRLEPDVLNIHSPLPASFLRPMSQLRSPRPTLISTVHNVRYRLPTMVLDRATGWLDTRTVAVSPQVARARTGRRSRGLSVRVHGVHLAAQRRWAARSEQTRQEWNVSPNSFLIVHVANFHPQKNHELLIEAAARVGERDSRPVFLLAGSGPLSARVTRRVDELGLNNVRLLGHVPDAARLIASSDLLVLSSSYEGLPVVIMEALAAGVPVVSTAVGGVPDLIEDHRNGLLVRPGDPVALAEAVLRATHPELHARLCEGARDSAELVDISRAADWFDKLYDEVCS
ncbi:glycosyltransferase [Streptosporangium lutulentum]|uniref:Glycosyltransferase involved in cell wall biosynthesis n=1 Tax=Streptosporangium lutulentum TaxID=1461250 RepID=A0ABT9Q4U4_9ACTN|nr:glycosyltransferase [Streptosporangium lutulentum]MDP9841383.1 glycosyltransferase involved in cell wall biosynthesis [Streptosporangium lutulentum]